MFKWASWPLVLAGLGALCLWHGVAPPLHVVHQTGNQLVEHITSGLHTQTAITGTIESVDRNYQTGGRTVHLQADDGAEITVVIPPTVTARVPHVGIRVQVQGLQTGSGVIMLDDSTKIAILAPSWHTSDRTTLEVTVYIVRQTPSGTLDVELWQDDRMIAIGEVGPQLANKIEHGHSQTILGYYKPSGRFKIEDVQ